MSLCKAIKIEGYVYLKRDLGFWLAVLLIWVSGIAFGSLLR
jgi:UPF0716 family protein affecting phage T7 exclusion